MYRGRFQLGEEIPLWVLCVDVNKIPVAVPAPPTCDIWSPTAKIQTFLLPAQDQAAEPGIFGKRLFLNATYGIATYRAVYRWVTGGGFSGLQEDYFEIVAGGNSAGSVISMQEFVRPPNRFFVQQLDSGKIVRGKNPRM